jgi:hypothetical protein
MSKIHIWIGTTKQTEEEYLKYFELDYSTEGDFEDPEYKLCQFCKDLSVEWYDEDFIGIVPIFHMEMPVSVLLNEIPLNSNEISNVLSACEKIGLVKANAIFYLTDAEIQINQPYKTNYNGLQYIGMYKSSLE